MKMKTKNMETERTLIFLISQWFISTALIKFGKLTSLGLFVDVQDEIIANIESLQFDFDTIQVATSHFSDSNKLGQGGFGAVYCIR